jgi:hypothetical protein
MSETNMGARASTVVSRIATKLSPSSLFRHGGVTQSRPSRFERCLEAGRENWVQPGLYTGRRNVGFDVEALFCYLVERTEGACAGSIEDVCEVYKARVGQLPVSVRRAARRRFEAARVSNASRGDDVRRLAAVDMLVDELAAYCAQLEATAPEMVMPVCVEEEA